MPGREKASCQPHRRHPCRRASAALEAALIEMESRGGGYPSRPRRAGLRSRGGGSQGLVLSPDRRVPRPLPWRSVWPKSPFRHLKSFQRSSRCPAAERHPAAVGGGIVPPWSRATDIARRVRRTSVRPRFWPVTQPYQPQNSSKNRPSSTIYNGGVAYPLAALYIV